MLDRNLYENLNHVCGVGKLTYGRIVFWCGLGCGALLLCVRFFLFFAPINITSVASRMLNRPMPEGMHVRLERAELGWKTWGRPFEISLYRVFLESFDNKGGKRSLGGAETVALCPKWFALLKGKFLVKTAFVSGLNYQENKQPQSSFMLKKDIFGLLETFLDGVPLNQLYMEKVLLGSQLYTFIVQKNKAQQRLMVSVVGEALGGQFFFQKQKSDWRLGGEVVFKPSFEGEVLSSIMPYKVFGKLSALYTLKDDSLDGHIDVKCSFTESIRSFVIQLKKSQATLVPFTFRTSFLSVACKGSLDLEGEYPFFLAMKSQNSLTVSELLQVWPAKIGTAARLWVEENMSGGCVQPSTALKGALFGEKEKAAPLIAGQLLIKNMDIKTMTGLPPVKKVEARGSFSEKALSFDLKKGTFSHQKLVGGKVHIYDFDADRQHIDMQTVLSGEIPNVVSILSSKALDLLKNVSVDLKSATGNAQTSLSLNFPLKEEILKKDVNVRADAKLTQVAYPLVLGKRVYPLKNSTLDLSVNDEGLTLKGTSLLWGENFRVTLVDNFKEPEKSRVDVVGRLTPDVLLGLDLGVLNSVLMTPPVASLSYALSGAKPLDIAVDLTSALVDIRPLWRKKKTVSAYLCFAIDVAKKNLHLQKCIFSSGAFQLKGDVFFNEDNVFQNAVFEGAEKGVKRFSGKLTRFFDNSRFEVTLQGEELDVQTILQNILSPEKTDSQETFLKPGESFVLSAYVNKLWLSDEAPLEKAVFEMRGDEKNKRFVMKKITANALVPRPSSGKAKKEWSDFSFDMSLVDPLRESLKIESSGENLGYILRALGWISSISGGYFNFWMQENVGTDEGWVGHLKAKKLALLKTNVARRILVILTSPTSFLRLFTGDKMIFNELITAFQLNNGVLNIKRARASAPDIAFAWHGWVDFEKKRIDLLGNVIPAYFLNQVLMNIPLIGRLLGGKKGDDGFFATRFYVKGALDDPQITANPLQAVTPGILKEFVHKKEDEKLKQALPKRFEEP